MKSERIYLDSINHSPLRPAAAAAMTEAMTRCANPSSHHAEGRAAAAAVQKARLQVAALIGARSEEIAFTSSGTESNLWALSGLAEAHPSKSKHLVVSAVEHLSILQTVRRMEKRGWSVTVLPVDRTGQVDPDLLEKALTSQTVLVSIQWANAEVGTLQRVADLVRRVKDRGILFHTDAVAAAGQIPIDLRSIPVDALSMAANLFGGPPGVGALFLRRGVRIVPLLVGGTQEEGRRAGTENLLGIIGMGAAAESARQELPDSVGRLTSLRDRLIHGILREFPDANLNGHPTDRLPGHVSLSFPGVDAEALVLVLDREGLAVGLGSACTARAMKASHVLKAMGIEESRALGTITCTLTAQTTPAQIDRVLEVLPRAVAQQGTVRPELVEG